MLEQQRGGWPGRWPAQNWWQSLERYAFPRIGRRPVSEVKTTDVLEILTPIWHVKGETARAVRQRIRSGAGVGPSRWSFEPTTRAAFMKSMETIYTNELMWLCANPSSRI